MTDILFVTSTEMCEESYTLLFCFSVLSLNNSFKSWWLAYEKQPILKLSKQLCDNYLSLLEMSSVIKQATIIIELTRGISSYEYDRCT